MDRTKAGEARMALENIFKMSAVVEELKKAGLSVTIKNGSFDDLQITFKVQLVEINSSGAVTDIAGVNFSKYAELFGMKKEWLGREISIRGESFLIVGLDPKKHKNNIIIAKKNGKRFSITPEAIQRLLA